MTIGHAIIKFINVRIGQNFTSKELRLYVMGALNTTVAPSSTDRALRRLRQQGKVNYEVINSNESLYRALPIAQEANELGNSTSVVGNNA